MDVKDGPERAGVRIVGERGPDIEATGPVRALGEETIPDLLRQIRDELRWQSEFMRAGAGLRPQYSHGTASDDVLADEVQNLRRQVGVLSAETSAAGAAIRPGR